MAKDTLIYLGLAATAYYLLTKHKAEIVPTEAAETNAGNTSASNPVATSPRATYSYPIVYGKYHPDVKIFQQALGVPMDGVVGPQTLARWQQLVPTATRKFAWYNQAGMLYRINEIKKVLQAKSIPTNYWKPW